MQYAVDDQGHDVPIDNARTGGQYKCRECSSPLIQCRGKIRAPYFSHRKGHGCGTETAAHKLAIRLVADSIEIELPYIRPVEDFRLSANGGCETEFLEIARTERETRFGGEGQFVPDVMIWDCSGELTLVEIHVAHRCDKDKIEYCRRNNIQLLEITIENRKNVRAEVFNVANMRWLSHRNIKSVEPSQDLAVDLGPSEIVALPTISGIEEVTKCPPWYKRAFAIVVEIVTGIISSFALRGRRQVITGAGQRSLFGDDFSSSECLYMAAKKRHNSGGGGQRVRI